MVFIPEVSPDERGFFMERFRADRFDEIGIPTRLSAMRARKIHE